MNCLQNRTVVRPGGYVLVRQSRASLLSRASSPSHVHHLPYHPPFYLATASHISSICISGHTMNDSSGTRLQSLFDAALHSYEKQTGLKLIDHPLARQLENCHTVDTIVDILQHQASALTGFRENDGKNMRSLKRVVHVLHALSTSATLGEGIGLVCLT